MFVVKLTNGSRICANNIINTSYASTNQILKLFNYDLFNIKYEMCEVIRCEVSQNFKNTGITVMDGPFFFNNAFWADWIPHLDIGIFHTP